jgi:hypothetical protein
MIIFSMSINVYGQERVIRGVVTTFDSIPLVGASVITQSSKHEVLTDSLGYFIIKLRS